MAAYASRTGTRRNLDVLRAAGWRLMISARGEWRTEGFARYALDNGAWTAYQRQEPFDAKAFEGVVEALARGADFVVTPDIVLGGIESLRFSVGWLQRLADVPCMKLLAVQNGMQPSDLRPLLGREVGIFVGGDDRWKESSLPMWGDLAHEVGCYLHVGRVNTARRMRLCSDAGVDSFDGSSASRFATTLGPLDRSRRTLAGQMLIPMGGED